MGYKLEEQETVIVYDNFDRTYDIYTTVPKHVRRLLKKYPISQFRIYNTDDEGNPMAVRIKVSKLPPASTFN